MCRLLYQRPNQRETHTRREENGQVHSVIPGKLLLFNAPSQSLTGDTEWAIDPSGRRLFCPRFYASLLCHLGVSTVLQLDDVEYSASSFTYEGIQHERLPPTESLCPSDPPNPPAGGTVGASRESGESESYNALHASLGGESGPSEPDTCDRFVALCDRTAAAAATGRGRGRGRGIVALHADGQMGYATSLIAALIRRNHPSSFSSLEDVVAWVSIVTGASTAVDLVIWRSPVAADPSGLGGEASSSVTPVVVPMPYPGVSREPPRRYIGPEAGDPRLRRDMSLRWASGSAKQGSFGGSFGGSAALRRWRMERAVNFCSCLALLGLLCWFLYSIVRYLFGGNA